MLGCGKETVNYLTSGRVYEVRLGRTVINSISEYLSFISTSLPSEFNRRPEKLSDIGYWKATQFRTFLLYMGPVVLQGKINKAVYEHFLLLHFGCSILLSERHLICLGHKLAQKLLFTFVSHCQHIYGTEFLVYNIHALTHLADDAKLYGSLNNVSAFPFENFLGQLKILIRPPNLPLQQLYNRLQELNYRNLTKNHTDVQYYEEHHNGPTIPLYPNSKQFKKITCKQFQFCIHSHSPQNSFFLQKITGWYN